MRLVIAEKPSMARAIAEALGVRQKGRNSISGEVAGSRVVITWCVGHLVEMTREQGEGNKSWSFASLPVLPTSFTYEPVAATRDQYEVVRELLHRPEVVDVVNATDAGREGQLIFHLVYQLAGCQKPVQRLWTSALTEDAIREAWRKMRPDSEWAGLTDAAFCRQHADWLVGINCTRAQTLVANAFGTPGIHSIGRVQTPTLAILVRREQEIRHFVPKDFWTLIAEFRTQAGEVYEGKWFRDSTPGAEATDRLDSEAAKAVGQLRRTDVHISLARQLAGVMRESIAANARAGRSLLVATDRAPTADLLRLMLVPEGFRVDTVPLQEALSACATEYAAPDAMLVDWGSSQSDGIAIAKGLGRIRRLDAVRLVLIILA